jgi:hypothetical protein
MSTSTLRDITLPATNDEKELKISIKVATAATKTLRNTIDKFIRASYEIWKKQSLDDTRLVATDDVRDEVIHSATAFHANSENAVDLVWIKKDMPMEALTDPDVGYWRAVAGPAPRLEQQEMRLIREIPSRVMTAIAETNDLDLIAHYLYAWIDFWCLILKHWLIWLACILFYGYLCILCPTIIVGESSKIFNIFRKYPPHRLFREDITDEDLATFLQGDFTLEFLQTRICVCIEELVWDEFHMLPVDYMHVIGIPVVVKYGPRARHYAIYIPKYHPYAPYHVPTLRVEILEVDRYARLMVELAQDVLQEATPLPSHADLPRRTCLQHIRTRIMQEAAKTGLLSSLADAKLKLVDANKAFSGLRRHAAHARTAADSESTAEESSRKGK